MTRSSLRALATLAAPLSLAVACATTNGEAHLREAIARLDALNNSHDDPGVRALYSAESESVFFYDALPFQLEGPEGLAQYGEQLFAQTMNYHQQTQIEQLVVGADVAAAACVVRASWDDSEGSHSAVVRDTIVFERIGDRWLISHEHASLPYDPATGKAVFDAEP